MLAQDCILVSPGFDFIFSLLAKRCAFSALTLLAGQQEGHWAVKN